MNQPMERIQAQREARILVVEDDIDLREALADTLELADFEVVQADSGEAALALLAEQCVDMVVSDVNMGGMDGLELLKAVRQQYPQLPVLLITAHGSIAKSVEAMRSGAVDYLVKPFKPQLLVEAVSRYAGGTAGGGEADQPVAVEASSQQVLALARRVAATDSTVLICGESGTGKEVLARFIHRESPRANGPFVAINCAAIPENMLEAMLFGHEKGAFTGAHQSMPGKFEQANGGTLLLDEISEMALPLQAKLLRVIQEREVERLGGRRTIALDVRILATTNRDLRADVAAQKFREDLYYRLSVFPLQWLPLRARPGDIVPIAERLLQHHAARMGRAGVRLHVEAERALRAHPWFGNVRELDNVMQRALIMQSGVTITAADLCLDPFAAVAIAPAAAPMPVAAGAGESASDLDGDLQRRELEIILDTLRATRGSKKTAAERLGISPRTLRYKLARLRDEGVDVEELLAGE
jgi:two-component system response regulator FlrC